MPCKHDCDTCRYMVGSNVFVDAGPPITEYECAVMDEMSEEEVDMLNETGNCPRWMPISKEDIISEYAYMHDMYLAMLDEEELMGKGRRPGLEPVDYDELRAMAEADYQAFLDSLNEESL